MKKHKILLIVFILACTASIEAQTHQNSSFKSYKGINHLKQSKSGGTDTIAPDYSGSAFYDTCSGGGYIGGINANGDRANLQSFWVYNSFSITKLLFGIAVKEGSGAITATIWSDSNGMPGSVIRRTTLPISNIPVLRTFKKNQKKPSESPVNTTKLF